MKRFVIPALLLAPMVTFAQAFANVETFLADVGALIDTVLPLLMGLAVVGIFWGLMLWVFAAGDADKRKKGVHYMVLAIVALAVMVSVWGLVNWLVDATGLNVDEVPTVPSLPSGNL